MWLLGAFLNVMHYIVYDSQLTKAMSWQVDKLQRCNKSCMLRAKRKLKPHSRFQKGQKSFEYADFWYDNFQFHFYYSGKL